MGFGQTYEQEERNLTGILLPVHLSEGNSVVHALHPRLALKRKQWYFPRIRDWR